MLLEIKVNNFAIIDNIHIQFKKGLNILSGETGAGKSVLLKSLALLMGGKASAESIRTGAEQATIEGSFDISKRSDLKNKLNDLGIECEEDLLVVRRIISQGDKSRIYLNGALNTLGTLRDVVAPLIEVAGHQAPLIELTGQHENKNLLSKAYHLDMLDQAAGLLERRAQYGEKYAEWKRAQQEIAELEQNSKFTAQRLDFLLYQRDEIGKLDLSPGEDVELEAEVKRLKNATRLNSFVDSAENALYGEEDSALTRIQTILKKGQEIANLDPVLAEKLSQLEQVKAILDDTFYDMRKHVSGLESDPQNLDRLEARLSDIRKLQKKYGPNLDDILKALLEMETEIGKLQNSDERLGELNKLTARLQLELKKLAQDLHEKRVKHAKDLSKAVNEELSDLNMKGVVFQVTVGRTEDLSAYGDSDVEFMTQVSAKDPLRALAKTASGGELSRILLSLKRVVGSSKWPRTYLFDEVDAGVSGVTAEKIGKKLRSIAKGQQVIGVTHLPQVAASGDFHFFIQKSSQKGSMAMEVIELNQKDRVQEIARLISGEKITKTSVAHAQELLGL
jgi:DNA repair protein RecN (Recombination protein N)